MTATIDHVALEWRIEALSAEILTTHDVLRKLDLMQARCEAREVLISLEVDMLDQHI
jgi:hypothetical protein